MIRSLVVSGLLLSLALLVAPAAWADADLQPIVNFPPAGSVIPLPAGSSSMIELTLFNNGPDVARNVMVRVELPPGVTIQYQGDERCDFTAVPIVCRAGDVPTDYQQGAPRFAFDLQFPLTDGRHTVVATATSDTTPDPKPENNRITATYTTTVVVDLHVNSEPGLLRIDPGQTAAVRVSVNNFVPYIDPKEVRVRFDAENGTIEKIEPPEGFTCTGGGATAECIARTLEAGCACSGIFTVTFRASADRSGGTAQLRTTATSAVTDYIEQNNRATTEIQRRRVIAVTTTADAGAGSLRAAINEANQVSSTPSKIAFEILGPVPAEGWFTIAPASPLPPLTAERVTIDGATQTALTGDTNPLGPEIALDGRFTSAGHGLELRSLCEAKVEHLAIGNFRDHAIAGLSDAICRDGSVIDQHLIAHDFLGVDPTGKVAWPNLRGVLLSSIGAGYSVTANVISGNERSGIWADRGAVRISENLIGITADGNAALPNGASGIYIAPRVGFAEVLRNTIAFHPQMGVAIARGADQIEVRENAMHDNAGLGIDWELDGVTPQRNDEGLEPSNAPILLSARYEAEPNRTLVTVSLKTGPMNGAIFGPAAVLDFYANDGPDGDGEHWLAGGSYTVNTNGDAFTYELSGDLRGKWLNATSTRIYFLFSRPPGSQSTNALGGGFTRTSELSNAVRVE
ncbi:MAG: trimeric autotransporter adhesin [Acidobacteriota bacterium]|nr:trimeric autotransporter adhesin [Acidobacteriota bacterium]